MKRLLLSVPSLLLLAGAAGAQTTAQNTANVQAFVQAGLVLSVSGATDFGSVNANQGTATINPLSPAPGTTTALFTATGQAGGSVLVSYLDRLSLTNASEASMAFVPALSSAASNAQASSTLLASASSAALSGSGNRYFWLGGTLTVAPNQPSGAYTGVFTLNVAY